MGLAGLTKLAPLVGGGFLLNQGVEQERTEADARLQASADNLQKEYALIDDNLVDAKQTIAEWGPEKQLGIFDIIRKGILNLIASFTGGMSVDEKVQKAQSEIQGADELKEQKRLENADEIAQMEVEQGNIWAHALSDVVDIVPGAQSLEYAIPDAIDGGNSASIIAGPLAAYGVYRGGKALLFGSTATKALETAADMTIDNGDDALRVMQQAQTGGTSQAAAKSGGFFSKTGSFLRGAAAKLGGVLPKTGKLAAIGVGLTALGAGSTLVAPTAAGAGTIDSNAMDSGAIQHPASGALTTGAADTSEPSAENDSGGLGKLGVTIGLGYAAARVFPPTGLALLAADFVSAVGGTAYDAIQGKDLSLIHI